MSLKARAARAAQVLSARRPRRLVFAHNWPVTGGHPSGRALWQCPEFDGRSPRPFDYREVFHDAPEEYRWTREALDAEAERRGVGLRLIEYFDLEADR